MAELGGYLAKWLFYYFMFGMALHVLDRYMGVPFYRWWYNRSRETPMPDGQELGFMYNRSFMRRNNIALVLSAVQSAYTVAMGGSVDPFFEIIVLVFEAEVLLVGFWAGRGAYAIIKRQRQIAEGVDRLESNLERAHLSGTIRSAVGAVKGAVGGFFTRAAASATPEPISAPPQEAAPKEEPLDWRAQMDRYRSKGG